MMSETQSREAIIALSPVQSTIQITKELNMAGYNKIDRVDFQEALLASIGKNKPQIAIISSELPGRQSSQELFSKISELSENTKVIFITQSVNKENLIDTFLTKNLSAWILSERSDRTLSLAIEASEAAQLFVDFSINKQVRELIDEKKSALTSSGADYGHLELLTEREAEVLNFLCAGSNYKSVAQSLFISESTVKTHINNIFTKLQVNDRTQAVLYAIRHDLESLMKATMVSH